MTDEMRPTAINTSLFERAAKAGYYALTTRAAYLKPGAPFKTWEELPEEQRNLQRLSVSAVLIALQEAGFAVVPREPTEAMVAAAEATGDHWYFDESWAAMIAASEPSHPKDSP